MLPFFVAMVSSNSEKGASVSIDLRIRIQHPVPILPVLQNSRDVMADMVGLHPSFIPPIFVEEIHKGVVLPLSSWDIKAHTPLWIIYVGRSGEHSFELNCFAMAEMMLDEGCDEEIETIQKEDHEVFAYLTVRGAPALTACITWALATSCAVALSQFADSNIIDDSRSWNTIYEQDAQGFLKAVKKQKAKELLEAGRLLREFAVV